MFRKHFETLKERAFQMWGHRIFIASAGIVGFSILIILGYSALFGPPSRDSAREDFVIAPGSELSDVARDLTERGFVRSALALSIAYEIMRGEKTLRPGGYLLSRDMDAVTVAKRLAEAPRLAWVTIPAGVRKEEIADILSEALGWREEMRKEWLTTATEIGDAYAEGVYFPDTYLIPSDQPPSEVAARLRGRFEEVFAPYADDIAESGKDWTEVIRLASLVEKEAAKKDKALVAGILQNRLDRGMLLQVDATLQYIAATPEDWWPVPDPDDKDLDSPFNTYRYEGLPPRAIANPSLASIEAALHPQKTSCLYYLHDRYGRIHCSTNYRAHVANVNRYLR